MSTATLVVGGGSWGTAVAAMLAGTGVPTVLWAREAEVVEGINTHQRNPLFLRDIHLPPSLRATADLDAAIEAAKVVVNAVPAQHIRNVFTGRGEALGNARFVVSLSKGIEIGTHKTPSDILADVLPAEGAEGVVCLSGPSFAAEVATGHPTAVVAASRVAANAAAAQQLFSNSSFRVYTSDDLVGVEIGGALKNVIAIAAGICEGLGLGHNSFVAMLTRGLAEITRLGVARGANPQTFAGLSGLGDLVLTCTGGLSRNRSVGVAIGRGQRLSEIEQAMEQVAEGVKTAVAALQLAAEAEVEMPITQQVYLVLYEDKDPHDAVNDLMERALRAERERHG